ncbi:MAG: GNAT family N-acetyltransferase [Candidatus Nanopelagicales bacterium]|nr:GNAT family N-acetyltransferase [Candidatus Nanopelagicales bacterium]MDZ4248951.1 GNAT family N-acetyltransferase [Candidatus Nanopelagicales bacterium]
MNTSSLQDPLLVIGTKRLRLLRLDEHHVTSDYVAWLNDPDVFKYLDTRSGDHTLSSVAGYVRGVTADENTLACAITVVADGRHIGNIKLGPTNSLHRRAEVGIMIGDRGYWGRGFATEAIAALSAFAFSEIRIEKLFAGAASVNVASIRAFQAAGFRIEALLPADACDIAGQRCDVVRLGRIAPWLADPTYPASQRE